MHFNDARKIIFFYLVLLYFSEYLLTNLNVERLLQMKNGFLMIFFIHSVLASEPARVQAVPGVDDIKEEDIVFVRKMASSASHIALYQAQLKNRDMLYAAQNKKNGDTKDNVIQCSLKVYDPERERYSAASFQADPHYYFLLKEMYERHMLKQTAKEQTTDETES